MVVTIGRFEVVRRLGRGGSGTVYLARDPQSAQPVAVKIFDIASASEEQRALIVSRLADVARLRHPNIAAIYDIGDHDGQPFVATEYVAGSTMAEILARTSPPRLVERLAMAEQLCAGLAYAHAAGVVHGNVAPAEIIVNDAGVVKVGEFGVPPARSTMTSTGGRSALRVNYLAPEQIEGRPLEPRVDIFAIGAVLYELVALRRAFPGGVEVLHRILSEGPVPLAEAVPDVDRELAAIVERALARIPENRYQHAEDVRRDLQRVRARLQGEDIVRPVAPDAAPRPGTIAPMQPPSVAAPGPLSDARESAPGSPDAGLLDGDVDLPGDEHGIDLLDEIVRRGSRAAPGSATGGTAVFSRNVLSAPAPVDDVQLTVYRPRAVRPARRSPMLVYTHLGDAREPGAPRPIEQVRQRAQSILGPAATAFRDSTTDGRHAIPEGGEITLLPEIPGVTFTPERHVFRWTADIHEHRFEIEAGRQLDGHVARGQLTAYLGVVLLAEVPLAIRVDSALAGEADSERSTARAYRRIFASYSRRDGAIVEQFERYVEALGDRYLRDVRNLRAGERWDDGLRRLIEEADVFQLFWSWNAMRSPNVRREWEYAISLNRPAFVRPTYWETPLPEAPDEGLPPPALRQLHFHCMSTAIAVESSPRVREDDDTGPVGPPWNGAAPRPPLAFPAPGSPSPRPAAEPGRPGPPAGRWPKIRPARVAGIAAGLMLAAVAGTVVWQTGALQTSTAVTTPQESPPPSGGAPAAVPPPDETPGGTDPADPPAPPSRGTSTPPSRGTASPPSRGTATPPRHLGTQPSRTETAAAGDVAAVRSVLTALAQAYRARDAAAVRRLWPSAPRELDDSLASARSYEVDFRDPQVSVSGNSATATASRRTRIVSATGEVQEATQPATFTFERTPAGWIVTAVR